MNISNADIDQELALLQSNHDQVVRKLVLKTYPLYLVVSGAIAFFMYQWALPWLVSGMEADFVKLLNESRAVFGTMFAVAALFLPLPLLGVQHPEWWRNPTRDDAKHNLRARVRREQASQKSDQ